MVNFNQKKVLVAISGGVDSAVAAYLLVKQGLQVAGAYLRLPVFPDSTSELVTSLQEDAQKICHKLGLPLFIIDACEEFQKKVIDYFSCEYLAGRTPNPCIACNQSIKFGFLLEKARLLGFDFLATGHYVSLLQDSERYFLQRAKDICKDQSYFLYTLSQAQLRRTIFPLGGYTKKEVRDMAKDLDLSVHDKAESQEICFLPQGDYSGFLKNRGADQGKGPILNQQGKVLGYHKGIYSYTIGQRRGLGLYNPSPLYVLAIDPVKKAIIVGEKSETYQDTLIASQLNWMLIPHLKSPVAISAQIRYRHKPRTATVLPLAESPDAVLVHFEEPQKSITPGQSVVFYYEDIVVGGGVIERVGGRVKI